MVGYKCTFSCSNHHIPVTYPQWYVLVVGYLPVYLVTNPILSSLNPLMSQEKRFAFLVPHVAHSHDTLRWSEMSHPWGWPPVFDTPRSDRFLARHCSLQSAIDFLPQCPDSHGYCVVRWTPSGKISHRTLAVGICSRKCDWRPEANCEFPTFLLSKTLGCFEPVWVNL